MYLDGQGFQQSPSNSNLYVISVGNDIILLVIYVDNTIITGSEASAIEQIESNISKDLDMTNLNLLHQCLKVEVWQTGSSMFFSQTKHAKSLFDMFKMTYCKISFIPMEKGLKLSTKTNSKEINKSICKQLVGSVAPSYGMRRL
jgi:hypothetical protein